MCKTSGAGLGVWIQRALKSILYALTHCHLPSPPGDKMYFSMQRTLEMCDNQIKTNKPSICPDSGVDDTVFNLRKAIRANVTSKERRSGRREGERLSAAKPRRNDIPMYENVRMAGNIEAIVKALGYELETRTMTNVLHPSAI